MSFEEHKWFERQFGKREENVHHRDRLIEFEYESMQGLFSVERVYVKGQEVFLLQNEGRAFIAGGFELVSLDRIRQRAKDACDRFSQPGSVTFSLQITHSAFNDHCKKENSGLFQVASQFNCLEFSSSEKTPEHGLTDYVYDRTQGPDCALAAAPALFYRQYCLPIENGYGQRADQLNTLQPVINYLKEKSKGATSLCVKNDYVQCQQADMKIINNYLQELTDDKNDEIRRLPQVGLVTNAEVPFAQRGYENFSLRSTSRGGGQFVHQVLCSALGVSYAVKQSGGDKQFWREFTQLVLESLYESTLWCVLEMAVKAGHRRVFLTFVSGGVFGNDREWIAKAINRACCITKVRNSVGQRGPELDVTLLHYQKLEDFYVQRIPAT